MTKVLYICNRMLCQQCSYPQCKHTSDINFAQNFSRYEADGRVTEIFMEDEEEDE